MSRFGRPRHDKNRWMNFKQYTCKFCPFKSYGKTLMNKHIVKKHEHECMELKLVRVDKDGKPRKYSEATLR